MADESNPSLPTAPLNVTLASSLLEHELERRQASQPEVAAAGRTRAGFQTGIPVLDRSLPTNIWSGGHVVGLGAKNGDDAGTNLGVEVIATHLLEDRQPTPAPAPAPAPTPAPTSVYIVAPPNDASASIQRLYGRLAAAMPARQAPRDPKTLLDRVSLLQYLDMAGLLGALAEVRADSHTGGEPGPRRVVLLVQGVVGALASMYRRSGLVQTAAVLGAVMRELRAVSVEVEVEGGVAATGRVCLVLVEVDVGWKRPLRSAAAAAAAAAGGGGGGGGGGSGTDVMLDTAFASLAGKGLKVNVGNAVLGRMLVQHVDMFVAVHDGDGKVEARKRIVEVVKDERFGGYGDGEEVDEAFQKWAVWDTGQRK